MIKELWNKCCRRSYNAFLNVLCVCMFSVRWDMLVDSPPIIQTEVRGGESACWRWPHTGQHVLREISGEPVQPWRTCSLTLTPSHETSIFVLITEEMFGDATALFSLSIYLLALDLRREACATAWALMHPSSRPSGASPPSTLEGVLLKAGCCRQWYRCSRCFQTESKSRGNVGKQTGLLYLYFWKGNPPPFFFTGFASVCYCSRIPEGRRHISAAPQPQRCMFDPSLCRAGRGATEVSRVQQRSLASEGSSRHVVVCF